MLNSRKQTGSLEVGRGWGAGGIQGARDGTSRGCCMQRDSLTSTPETNNALCVNYTEFK